MSPLRSSCHAQSAKNSPFHHRFSSMPSLFTGTSSLSQVWISPVIPVQCIHPPTIHFSCACRALQLYPPPPVPSPVQPTAPTWTASAFSPHTDNLEQLCAAGFLNFAPVWHSSVQLGSPIVVPMALQQPPCPTTTIASFSGPPIWLSLTPSPILLARSGHE
jgi:hypothetical protein